MKKTLALLALIMVPIFSYCYDVKFGPAEKAGKRNLINVLGEIDGKIYIYKYKSLPLGVEKHTLHQFNGKTMELENEVDLDIKQKNKELICIFNGKVLVFLSETDQSAGEQRLYYNVYDGATMSLTDSDKDIAKFEYNKGKLFKRKGSFRVIFSKDKKNFAAYYDLPYEKSAPERFGITLYDSDFNQKLKREVSLPVSDELMTLNTPYVSNSGRFYISAREVTEKTLFGNAAEVAHHIFEVTAEGELADYKIDLGDKYIYEYTYEVNDNDNLICSGLYGLKKQGGIAGGFYARIGGESKSVEQANYKDFPLEFITLGWSDRAKEKAEKKKNKNKGNPTFYNYDIRDLVTLKNGGVVLTAEQYYVRVVTTVDAQGNRHTTYYYYYNDIIVMKLNKEGEFEWFTKIPKYQVSTNDGGYYSSYAFHVSNEKMYFMFNDNLKNFEQGNAVGGKTYPTNFKSNKYNVTSLVEMNIVDGKSNKNQLFSKAELKTIAVPKIHLSNKENDVLYIYGKKKTIERLGAIQF